jgi:hypothetical protein
VSEHEKRERERENKIEKRVASREEFAEILIGCLFSDFLLPSRLLFSPSFVFILRSLNLYIVQVHRKTHTKGESNGEEKRARRKLKSWMQIRRRAKLLEGSSIWRWWWWWRHEECMAMKNFYAP